MDVLQLTLVAGIIIMALVNAASLVWASYLDHQLRRRPAPKIYEVHVEGSKVFSEMDLTEVEKEATEQMRTVLHEAAKQLQDSVTESTARLGEQIQDNTNTTLGQEFEKYQVSLQALRDQTIQEYGKLQKDLDARRSELLEEIERNVGKEHEKMVDQFNTRMGDVIAAYLVESLGNQVDLGAQTSYILQNLEQHKEDIKRDVLA